MYDGKYGISDLCSFFNFLRAAVSDLKAGNPPLELCKSKANNFPRAESWHKHIYSNIFRHISTFSSFFFFYIYCFE